MTSIGGESMSEEKLKNLQENADELGKLYDAVTFLF